MRTFAVAALAAMTQAQSTQMPAQTYSGSVYKQYPATPVKPSYPSYNPYQPKPEPVHSHDYSIMHEKPWEQCQRDIVEVQDRLGEDKCEDLSSDIQGMAVTYMSLDMQVNDLTQQAMDNQTAIDGIVTTNGDQDAEIVTIGTGARQAKTDINEYTSQCQVLEYEISKLPDLDALIARLVDIETKQTALMMEIIDNAASVTGFNDTLNGAADDGLLSTVQTLEDDATALDGQINGTEFCDFFPADASCADILVKTSTANMMNADLLTTEIADKAAEFEKQRILEDYYFVNSSDLIMIDAAVFQLPNSCFTIDGAAVDPVDKAGAFEFFFSGVFDAQSAGGSQVYGVTLLENGAPVASSQYDSVTVDDFSRSFSLLYKAKVDDNDFSDYQIQIDSILGSDGLVTVLANSNIQWGYRVYTQSYPLDAAAPTC